VYCSHSPFFDIDDFESCEYFAVDDTFRVQSMHVEIWQGCIQFVAIISLQIDGEFLPPNMCGASSSKE
jgi:hypothetical protein